MKSKIHPSFARPADTRPVKPWLWPDRVIGKCESGALREEHNKAVNVAHDLLEACEQLIELADSGAVIDLADNDATPISRRIRAAIAKAGGASS